MKISRRDAETQKTKRIYFPLRASAPLREFLPALSAPPRLRGKTVFSPSRLRGSILLAAGIVLALSGCAAYGPPREWGEAIHRGIVFATPGGPEATPLRLDLYVPPRAARPAPVVLWIFGGSWKFGSRAYHVNVRDLTHAGIAVAAIDYRLSGDALYPAQLEDCQSALRWLRANGPRYGLDPARIGVAGESAGGHLAALLGTAEGTPNIRAALALYPVTDLVALGRQYSYGHPSDIERLLGGPIEQKLPLARAASPVNHISANSPPFLIITGAKDTLVPPWHSQELDRRLRAAGVESTLELVSTKGHWFLLDPAQRAKVAQFFRRHFGMSAE